MADLGIDQDVIQRQPQWRQPRRPRRIDAAIGTAQAGFPQQGTVPSRKRGHVEIAGDDHRALMLRQHRYQAGGFGNLILSWKFQRIN